MADPISSVSVTSSPVGLSTLTGVTPAVLQLLSSESSATVSSIFASSSTVVQVSGTGQLLSAVSAFTNALDALQANPADATPASVRATAQGLANAFNGLQDNVSNAQTIFGSLTSSVPVDQFSLTLNGLATAAIATGTASLGNLQSIGIELQSTVSLRTGATDFALSLNQNTLNAAATADPAGTQALLDQAITALRSPLTGFEAQAATLAINQNALNALGGTTTQPVDLTATLGLDTTTTAPGATVPTNLLQLLTPDTVANGIQLTDLDLAAAGVDIGTVLSQTDVLRGSLAATVLTPAATATVSSATIAQTLTAATATAATTINPAQAAAATATPTVAATTTATPTTTAAATVLPTTTAPTPTVATAAPVATTATAAADVAAADLRAAAATQAVQNQLLDPTRLAIANNRFDSAYAAIIAASHLSDFVSPMLPGTNPASLVADIPAQVLPAAAIRAIGYYNEASMAELVYRTVTPVR